MLRDVLREVGTTQPERLVMRFAEASEAEVTPLYRRTLADDRARMTEIQADIAGTPHLPADPAWSVSRALLALSVKDPRILRAYVRNFGHILDQGAAFDEPGVRAVFDQLAPTLPRYPDTTPTRAQVLAAVRAVEHSPAYVPA